MYLKRYSLRGVDEFRRSVDFPSSKRFSWKLIFSDYQELFISVSNCVPNGSSNLYLTNLCRLSISVI